MNDAVSNDGNILLVVREKVSMNWRTKGKDFWKGATGGKLDGETVVETDEQERPEMREL